MKLFTKLKKAGDPFLRDLHEIKSEEQFLQSAHSFGYLLAEVNGGGMPPILLNLIGRMTVRSMRISPRCTIVQYVGRGANRGRFGIVSGFTNQEREVVSVSLAPVSLEESYYVKIIHVKRKNLKTIDWPAGAPKVYFLSKVRSGSYVGCYADKNDEEGLRGLYQQLTTATDHVDLQWRLGIFKKKTSEPLLNSGVLLKADGTIIQMSELKAVIEDGEYETAIQMLS